MKMKVASWLVSFCFPIIIIIISLVSAVVSGENNYNESEPEGLEGTSLEDLLTTQLPVLSDREGSSRLEDEGTTDFEGQIEEDDDENNETGDDVSMDQIRTGELKPIRFLLFNDPIDVDKFEVTDQENANSLRTSGFDPSKSIKILIHGFRGKHNGTFPRNVKEAYLKTKSEFDYNIFVIDWRTLALPGPKASIRHYPGAVRNVRKVADRLADFITWLRNDFNVNLDNIHLIGHSLGAHVAGNAGDTVIRNLGHAVGRITGLDPAGPEFYPKLQGTRRLHSTDAQYVDVIHTNGGKLGIYKNIGSADFWVNPGAKPQPGCGSVKSTTELQQLMSGSCSHRMATYFYANTIKNHEVTERCACSSRMKFSFGKKCCDRKVVFGEFSPSSTRGTFYMSYQIANITTTIQRTGEGSNTSSNDSGSKGTGMKGIWHAVRRWFSSKKKS